MLWGALGLAFFGSAAVWIEQAIKLGVGAWHYAPSQALWPAALRNQWVLTIIVVVVTLALGLAPIPALQRESLWMFLWPALAASIWLLAQPVAFGTQLWEGAADQITLYVIGYLSCFTASWLIIATIPE